MEGRTKEGRTKASPWLTKAIRSILAASPEASLWTAVAPAIVEMVGAQSGLAVTFPAWVAGAACLVGGIIGGLWLPDVGGSEDFRRTSANAALFVAAGLVGAAAVLGGLGWPAALAWLFAYWRGISAAGYGRYPYYLRRALAAVLVAFGVSGLLLARSGPSLPALLAGLFAAVATGLGALLLWADSTIFVGANNYSLPYTGWHYRVAVTTIAVVVGLPAVLLSVWALWAGPAASGLGVLGQSASYVANGLLNLLLKILSFVLIPIFWFIGWLVAWAKGRQPFNPSQGLLGGESAVPEWVKEAANRPLKSLHVPTFIILGALVVVAVLLIYRLVRSAMLSGSQSLTTEFEDLAPTSQPRGAGKEPKGRRAPLRALPPVRAAYRAFLLRLVAVGWRRSPSTTPNELNAQLALGPEAQADVEALTATYVHARYGPPGRVDEQMEDRAVGAWTRLKTRLVKSRLGAGDGGAHEPGH